MAQVNRHLVSLPDLSDGDSSEARILNELPAISHVPQLLSGTYTAPILLAR